MLCIKCLIIFYIPCLIETVNVDVEGFIDVNLKTDFFPNDKDFRSFENLKLKKSIIEQQDKKDITLGYQNDLRGIQITDSSREITTKQPYKVKDIKDLSQFAEHVYKNSLKTIKKINKKIDRSLRSKLDVLEEGYKLKFKQFINESLDCTVKTKLGRQKLILHTLQTSDYIFRRLINHIIYNLAKDTNHTKTKRKCTSVEKLLQSEIRKNNDDEYKYICRHYKICRTSHSFTSFMIEQISIMANLKTDKIKVATDAMMKVLKETDVSRVMDQETEAKFKKNINTVESLSGWVLKPIYAVFKNILINRYKPIPVSRQKYTRNAISSLPIDEITEVLDTFNAHLPPVKDNVNEWNAISKSLVEWSEGKRDDILEICQRVVNQFKKAVDAMDAVTLMQLKTNFKRIFVL